MLNQDGAEESKQETALSKNKLKRLAKRAAILANRPEKRRLEKEKKRHKKLELATKRANGELPAVGETRPKVKLMSESSNKFRIVIDMDFENLMTDQEIAKAAKQVARVYAINRKSENPCQLYISSLKGKIRDRFAITCTGYTNWDVHMSECDYLDLFIPTDMQPDDKTSLEDKRNELRNNIIYLSGDTEENLPDVEVLLQDESKIFVIGGLVDHNRHKNLCYQRAQERHIKTAKLPIKEFVKLCDRHILSTVTVFDIMQRVLGSHKSWKEAFLESIPSRKLDQEAIKSGNQDNSTKPVDS